jgi:2-phospho-L-lactate/phosphoenolpyruvate guanylyltransferase
VEAAVLLPVKDFRQAKARLADAFDPEERAALARWMAGRVVDATSRPVFVVCDSDEVATWAIERAATVVWTPGVGLNAAAREGVAAVARAGYDHVVVAHSDLPLAGDVALIARPGVAVLVPDSRCDGTNVIALPARIDGFEFHYGPASFEAHLAEATRVGLVSHVEHDESLALDVDTLDDVRHPLIAASITEAFPSWTPPTSPASHR